MKKLLISILFLLVLMSPVYAQVTGKIIQSGETTTNLFFTGDSGSPKTWYQDAMDGNPDVGIELCGAGQKYVGAAYAINVGGTWKYSLITYHSSSEALAYTDQSGSSGCYYTTLGQLTFSPSHLSTPNPDVYFAAFPGKVRIVYESSANPGNLYNFAEENYGQLLGSYIVTRSYDQGSNQIEVDTPTIQFQSAAGTITKQADDSTFGVSSDRRMVVGICSDDVGDSCTAGVIVPTEATFPLYLSSGVSPVDDQHKYDRYVVINSLGQHICIGANLKVKIDDVSPDPVYYSQNLYINYTITNYRDSPTEDKGGNVRVTTDFNVEVKIYRQDNSSDVVFDHTYLISDDLSPGQSIQRSLIWPAYAKSGTYVVKVTVDPDGIINECDESDNTNTKTFELKPIIIPEIWIDGNQTDTFPFVGVPFNLTLHLRDSDGLNVSNALVRLIERNGVTSFVPTQIWNASINSTNTETVGVTSVKEADFPTDYYGKAEITIIPSGNPLYAPEYSRFHITDVVGEYGINLTGTTSDGDPFVFVVDGKVVNNYPLKVENYYKYENVTNITSNEIPNLSNFVEMMMNTVYTIFSKFWKVMAG